MFYLLQVLYLGIRSSKDNQMNRRFENKMYFTNL